MMRMPEPKKKKYVASKEIENRYEKVDSWFDIISLEHQILKFWDSERIFEKSCQKNKGNERYSFLDGPITANNPMGVHHAWGRTYKDAYQRYWAMNGRDERYQNGFDCQGLWVEVEVEKEKGFTSSRQIVEYGIDRFVEDCKARVRKYAQIITDQSIRLGQWMDWNNSYYTMSDRNNYMIWHFLKKCHERGKIYKGTDVMPWSGRSGCAYSHQEVIEGRKLVAHTAVFVSLPLRGRQDEHLLVWTTTPWTLTSNVAAAVNVDLEYVRIRSKKDGQVYILAKDNLNHQRLAKEFKEKKEWIDGVPKLKTIAQIFNERGGFEIEGVVKGMELVGLEYDGPFDELPAQSIVGGYPFTDNAVTVSASKAHRVIDGGKDTQGNPVVIAGEGTGIVHIAPGCGDIDHKLGMALGLPAISPLDEGANFLPPFAFLAGRNATDKTTVRAILDNLKEKGILLAAEQYPHVYPHCWRTGDELVFRLVDEWFILMDWRDEIKRCVDTVRWIPSWGHDREQEWLNSMSDWMISKKRFWGLALPIWVCAECDHFDVIGGYDELQERAIEGWEDFAGHTPHRPWIDCVKIACPRCGGKASRIPDVGNPWLDAGIVPYSTTGYDTSRDQWAKWMPADLVLECFPGQFRNWFYSMLAMSAMLEGIAPFKNLKGHELVVGENGREMHKSWGNAIWFDEAVEAVGADVMRWMYMRSEPTVRLRFGYNALREVRGKFINTFWNAYGFYVNYARIVGFFPDSNRIPFKSRPDFDRWILTELQWTIDQCRVAFEDYNIRKATLAIEAFFEKLSNWYIRNNRRRFWLSPENTDTKAAFETLFECLDISIRLVAPILPFMTEKIYQNMVRAVNPSAPESVHLHDYPRSDTAKVDREATGLMDALMRLNKLGLSARESQKIKIRQPLSSLTIGPKDLIEQSAANRFSSLLCEILNVKSINILEPGTESPLKSQLKPNFKTLGPRFGKAMQSLLSAIESAKDRLIREISMGEQTFKLEVEGTEYTLEANDLIIEFVTPEGQAVAESEDRGTWVAFNTVIDETLRIEGIMRDILRELQVMRKNEGFEIEDRIELQWDTSSEEIEQVFERYGDLLGEELLVEDMVRNPGLTAGKPLNLHGLPFSISITKA